MLGADRWLGQKQFKMGGKKGDPEGESPRKSDEGGRRATSPPLTHLHLGRKAIECFRGRYTNRKENLYSDRGKKHQRGDSEPSERRALREGKRRETGGRWIGPGNRRLMKRAWWPGMTLGGGRCSSKSLPWEGGIREIMGWLVALRGGVAFIGTFGRPRFSKRTEGTC